MKVVMALAAAVALAGFAGEARAQQKRTEKEELERLKEKLEGAEIRVQIAKARVRAAEADEKLTKELLKTTEKRLEKIEAMFAAHPNRDFSFEDVANLYLTRDKYRQEAIQKQAAVEVSQLEVRYREWQYRRVEAAIKRLKAGKEK